MTGDPRSRVADGGSHHEGLFESLPDPLLAYASANESDASEASPVVIGVNPAFEAVFDIGADEVTGGSLDEVVLAGTVIRDLDTAPATADADPSAAESAGSLLDRIRESGTVRFEAGTDDRTRCFRIRTLTTGTDGRERGYLLFTDVTELERRRRDLAATVARLERLASVASHDLRNPLEVAEIRLEAARETGDAVHFETVADALDRIEQIVRDVLAVGGGGVDPTGAVALEGVADAAWGTVETAGAELVASPGLGTVRGDADRLRQLFENLFRNAVEHAGPDVTVTVEPLSDGFAVVDDGPGIPEAARERAFEAGYSTEPGNGGLGLSIVDQIAREHGWRVSLAVDRDHSDGDDGARFEFTGIERIESEDDASE